jgi:hypothetical protein
VDTTSVVITAVEEHLRAAHGELREVVADLDPATLDATLGPDTNSLAVLVAHTIETERSIVQSVIGEPLPRDREAAFRTSGLSADDVAALIDHWEVELGALLARVTAEDLARPIQRWRTASGAWWLQQTVGHAREHAGQAQLTRQLLSRGSSQPETDQTPG